MHIWKSRLQVYVRRRNFSSISETAPHGVSVSDLISDLKACSRSRNLAKGKLAHARVRECGAESNLYVANTLIDMYCKCECLFEAQKIFDGMPRRSATSWNALLQGYAENREAGIALEIFSRMQRERSCLPDARTFVFALKACGVLAAKCSVGEVEGKLDALEKGMTIHGQAAKSGCCSDIYVLNTLIDMYTRCGSVLDARQVFDRMDRHDVISWNSLMFCYAENDGSSIALELLSRMSCMADGRTYTIALKACSALAATDEEKQVGSETLRMKTLEKGMTLHAQAITSGLDTNDVFVSTSLIDMYSRCGSLKDARTVFDRMRLHDVVCWTALVLGYVENGEPDLGLELFRCMHEEGCQPNAPAFVSALKACSCKAVEEDSRDVNGQAVKLSNLERAMDIHRQASESGCLEDVFLLSSLSDVYGKCGSMLDARLVFDRMAIRDIVSWNSLLVGYAENREEELVLELFENLKQELSPNDMSYVAALKACTGLADVNKAAVLENVMEIHSQASESGYDSDMLFASTLAGIYAELGWLNEADRVFHNMHCRDVISWTRLILGYISCGEYHLALDLFHSMLETEACEPASSTYVAALKACAGIAASEGKAFDDQEDRLVKRQSLERAMEIHSRAASQGWEQDMSFSSSLVSTYSKCGCMEDARRVFDRMESHSVVLWTALLMGYSENGEEELALELFDAVKLLQPNTITYVAALKSCTSLAVKELGKEVGDKLVKLSSLEKGMSVHSRARSSGCPEDLQLSNVLVDMYGKCGSLADARKVFDRMKVHSLVSWTTLVMSYAENSEGETALKLFMSMNDEFSADVPAYVAALKACETRANIKAAKGVHGEICRRGLEDEEVLETCLVDVYAKCGSLDGAQRAFDSVKGRRSSRLVTWNALMAGYSRHGDAEQVVNMFSSILEEGLRVDGVTFICLLTVFSHAGMVERGNQCFTEMSSRYGVSRRMEHYTCMVDMLSRANQLEYAVNLLRNMPFQAGAVTWTAVMSACCRWKNLETGRLAFEALRRLDERDGSAYLLMSNLYGSLGMWEEQSELLLEMNRSSIPRKRGVSWWFDPAGEVHSFGVGDLARIANRKEIEAELERMNARVKEAGHVGDAGEVVHNITEEQKERFSLCSHSERLAIACALVNSEPGTTIRIGKNLRVCADCHDVVAVVSLTERRRIVCRDARRFHVFADGKCSCGDFW